MRQRIIVFTIITIAFAWSLVLRDRHAFRVHVSHSGVELGSRPSLSVDEITIRQLKAWARECSPAPARSVGAFHIHTFDYVTPEGEEIAVLDMLVEDDSAGIHGISCMGLR